MTDDPIIEIIARAIASSDGINPDERLLFGPDDDGAYEAYWKHYEDNARAVIAIAKPLITAEAREAALKEAAETVWNAPLGVLAAYDAVRALYEKPQ